MMSGVPLETCWAFNKRWNNKFYYKVASCWLFLLIHITKHGSMNIKKIYTLKYLWVERKIKTWLTELQFTCTSDGCKTLSLAMRDALRLMVFQKWHWSGMSRYRTVCLGTEGYVSAQSGMSRYRVTLVGSPLWIIRQETTVLLVPSTLPCFSFRIIQ